MVEGEDWLMRPVLRGLCRFESLKDGTLDIMDLVIMNEAIDVEQENAARAQAALEAKAKGK